MRIEFEDFQGAQRLRVLGLVSVGCLGFDLSDQFTDPLLLDSQG
jgi:hypothetical protein